MSEKDIQNLIELAKQKLSEKVSREQVLASFVAAGILDEKGEFTKPYEHLRPAKK